MRILLWHGYLLGGTGSNVYTRQLAREWSRRGTTSPCSPRSRDPERYDLGGARAVRPDVGGLLPVFVLDRYEGYEVRRVQDCTRAELDALGRGERVRGPSAAPRRRSCSRTTCCSAARSAPRRVRRFAVKAHGSELEYSMRGNAELSAWGAEALAPARATFVGSAHIRNVLAGGLRPRRRRDRGAAGCRRRRVGTRASRTSRSPRCSTRRVVTRRTPATPRSGCPTTATPPASSASSPPTLPVVVYFGKLIEQKGVHVLARRAAPGSTPRLVVVGFGPERAALEQRAAERGVDALFTGPLEHRHLRHLLALADACVVPSIFPEAFGMVAAEAAAAGCPPLVARHSGLAEVAAGLEEALPAGRFATSPAFASGDAGRPARAAASGSCRSRRRP